MREGRISSFIRTNRYVELLATLLYIILTFIALSAISYILVSQEDLTSSSWWTMVRYSRLGIVIFCVIFLIAHTIIYNSLDYITIKIFFCLAYITVVAIIFYFPGLISFFSDVFAWPLVYLVFYLYSKKHSEIGRLSFIVSFYHLIICSFLVRTFVINMMGGNANPGSVYHSLCFLPLVLLLSKRKTKIVLSIFTSVLLFLSEKRTGILALTGGFVFFAIVYILLQEKPSKKIKKIIFIIFVGILIFSFFMFYSTITEKIFQRFSNISYDQGSGRTVIWQLVLEKFNESSFIHKVFGHGIQAVPVMVHPYNKYLFSHNSYIEYLYDLGIVGVVFLFILVLSMLVSLFKLIRCKNIMAPTAAFAFCITIAISFLSYFFEESNYILMIACYWGIMRGKCFGNNKKISINRMK